MSTMNASPAQVGLPNVKYRALSATSQFWGLVSFVIVMAIVAFVGIATANPVVTIVAGAVTALVAPIAIVSNVVHTN